MSLIKRLFFVIFACVGVICFSIPNVFGLAANSCSTGGEYQYCGLWRKCKTCPANCYCPPRANPNTVSCTGWTGLKCEAGVLKSNTNHTESQGSFGVYACPSDFPNAPEGAKSAEDCYLQCTPPGGRQQLKNKVITCKAGEMLNYRQMTCVKCNDKQAHVGQDEYCPGGSFYPSCSKNQGVQKCENGTKPNTDRNACLSEKISCGGGMYLPKGETKCRGCPPTNVYCPGIKDVSVDKTNDQGVFSCPEGTKQAQNRQSCELTSCPAGQYLANAKCNDCPSRFPKSSYDSKSESECYTLASDGKTKLYNKLIVVPAGQYLPKESMSPAKCPSGKYCKGSAALGKPEGWGPRFGEYGDIGAYNCDAGQKPNADATACVKKDEPKKEETTTCEPGYYLPSGLSTCETCLDGSACKGGTFTVKSGNQGIVECKVGYETVSDDKSRCIVTAAKCAPGFYLKANKDKCTVCEGTNKYCPGGDFGLADYDQGIHSCPINGNVNGDRSGCKIKLSKTSMYYGLGGKNTNYMDQCWSSKSIEEYKVCLFGIQD